MATNFNLTPANEPGEGREEERQTERDERALRRDQVRDAQEKEEEERRLQNQGLDRLGQAQEEENQLQKQDDDQARQAQDKEEQERQLMDQGVLISDGEDAHLYTPHIQQDRDEDDWSTEQSSVFSTELNGAEDEVSERVLEIQEKTHRFQAEQQLMEIRMDDLDRREKAAAEHERELSDRQKQFKEELAIKEAKIREDMNKKLQQQMYEQSLQLLQKMEVEMAEKQRIAEQREIELVEREKSLREAEVRWKMREAQLEKDYLEQVKKEVENEFVNRATALHTPPPSEKKSQIIGGARRKDTFYDPARSQIDFGSTYRKEIEPGRDVKETENLIKKESKKRKPEETIAPNTMPNNMKRQYENRNEDILRPDKTHVEVSKTFQPDMKLAPPTSSQLSDTAPRSFALQRQGKDNSKENDVGETNTVRPPVYDYGKVPTISKFSGSTPVPKSESSFEDWKLEVESLIEMNMYPDIAIAQNIRRSLVGQAKSVLQAMGPKATSRQILSRLQSIFGNVASGEAIMQEFYTAEQRFDESTVDWGLRIENILHRAIEKKSVKEDKNEKLKSKFWRSLSNQDLKNATKMYLESIEEFDEFRMKVRQEEYTMNKVDTKQTEQKQNKGRQAVQHQPVVEMSGDHLSILQSLVERMTALEQSYNRQYNQRSYGRGRHRGRRGRGHGRRGRGRCFYDDEEYDEDFEDDKKEETEQMQPATQKPGGLNSKKSPSQGR